MKRSWMIMLSVSACVCVGSVSAQDSVKVMPMGDSITELDWQGGYRSYLYKLLSDSGFVFDYVGRKTNNHNDGSIGFTIPPAYWNHEGYSGRAIYPTWLDSVRGALTANPPDIILLMLGTNDAANGTRSSLQIRDFMSSLLDSIWTFDPVIRVVLSNIPRSVPGSLFNPATLDTIVGANALWPAMVAEKQQAGRYITMVDNYSALTETADFTGDGVHPSVAGYKKMRYVWYPAVVSALMTTSVSGDPTASPGSFRLSTNFPNPFNPSTSIQFELARGIHVTIKVHDSLGREVATLVDERFAAGKHAATWNAVGMASGVYYCRMKAGNFSATERIMLVR